MQFSKCIFIFVMLVMFNSAALVKSHASNVTVTAYYISETTACGSRGYRLGSSCATSWTVNNVKNMLNNGKIIAKVSLNPFLRRKVKLKLGSFSRVIKDYVKNICGARTCGAPLHLRKSILLVFKWDEAQTGNISLVRSTNNKFNIPYAKYGYINNTTSWIDHQRADAFLPKYKLNWKLTLPNSSLIFYTN